MLTGLSATGRVKRCADCFQHAGRLMVAARDAEQAKDLDDQYGLFLHVVWWMLSSLRPTTPLVAGSAEASSWIKFQAADQMRLINEARLRMDSCTSCQLTLWS